MPPSIHSKPPPGPPTYDMPLWQWLKHHRLQHGWSRMDLSLRSGVSRKHIWLLETAQVSSHFTTLWLRGLCKALEMSQDDTEHTYDLSFMERGKIPDDLCYDTDIVRLFADLRRKRRKKFPELYEHGPIWDKLAEQAANKEKT